MWLGMVAAAIGQLAWAPVEPLTWLAGLLAAYIDQVAAWFAAPGWAQPRLELGGPGQLVAVYAALALMLGLVLRVAGRRGGLRPAVTRPPARRLLVAVLAASVVAAGFALAAPRRQARAGLTVTVLDVGQGDAILLEPRDGAPILVDAGPAGAAVAADLRARGMAGLAALVLTHTDADHVGGAPAVLSSVGAEHLAFARAATRRGRPRRRRAPTSTGSPQARR